jgi:hypothetical protein
MARIRSVRPEFCTSLAIAELSLKTQLHFVRLWTHCDDEGRAVDDPRLIKGACWPLEDGVSFKDIKSMQDELAEKGRIVRYEVAGRPYFEVVNWHEHQKPNRPVPSKLPERDPSDCTSHEASVTTHVQHSEDSVSTHEHLTPVVVVGEGDGVVGGEVDRTSPDGSVRSVFDEWVSVTGRTPRTILDDKRRRIIERAIKSHGIDTVLDAVRGWQNSAFHRGQNDTGTVYDDLGLILRDAGKIEGFARCWHEPPTPANRRSTTQQNTVGTLKGWAMPEHPEHTELEAG